jgi:hypothetical protein
VVRAPCDLQVRAYHYITYTSKAVPTEPSLPSAGGHPPGLKLHTQQPCAASSSQTGSAVGSKTSLSSGSLAQAVTAAGAPAVSSEQQGDAANQQAAKLSALKHVLRLTDAQQPQQHHQQQQQLLPAQHLQFDKQQQARRVSDTQSDQDNMSGLYAPLQSPGSDMPHTADHSIQQQQQQQQRQRLRHQHAHAIQLPAIATEAQQQRQQQQQHHQQQQCVEQPDASAGAGASASTPPLLVSPGVSWALDSWASPGSCPHGGLESPGRPQRTPGGSLRVMLCSRTWLVQVGRTDCGLHMLPVDRSPQLLPHTCGHLCIAWHAMRRNPHLP